MGFCKEFNARTQPQAGMIIPVVITVFSDRSFTFITKTPPASVLIKKELGLKIEGKPGSGSKRPNKDKVGKITQAQIKKLAELKIQDTNAGAHRGVHALHRGHRSLDGRRRRRLRSFGRGVRPLPASMCRKQRLRSSFVTFSALLGAERFGDRAKVVSRPPPVPGGRLH